MTLKWIAIVTMFIDHLGIVLTYAVPEPVWRSMRIIGRTAFPIFCFLLVEGFYHTRDIKKYLVRLGIFALISEAPFDLMIFGQVWYPEYQNVFFTLLIGLFLLYLYNRFLANVQPIYAIMAVVSMLCLAYLVKCDYGAEGVLMIYLFFLFRFRPVGMYIGVGLVMALMGGIEIFAVASFLPIALYNGEKGGKTMERGKSGLLQKYFFYFFYPVHILFLTGLRYLLYI